MSENQYVLAFLKIVLFTINIYYIVKYIMLFETVEYYYYIYLRIII